MEPRIICVGGGFAGVYFSLRAAKYATIDLFFKDAFFESNSYLAKGGIAVALGVDDSIEKHIQDTLKVGDGLCDPDAVNFIIGNSTNALNHLIEMGVEFNKNKLDFDLGKEGGHSSNRIVHIQDETGKFLMETLYARIKNHPKINLKPYRQITDLYMEEGVCKGARFLNTETGNIELNKADAVVMATGGYGQLFLKNTNSSIATGEGIAIAHRAGAKVNHLEFLQFHPTMLYENHTNQSYLITEAFRGAGAILVNTNGEAYMNEHPLASLAPRDIVSRKTFEQMLLLKSPFVYLKSDLALVPILKNTFPGLAEVCNQKGIPLENIPVTPAAHYCCGGVVTDLNGQTSLPNLYAIGEVACTGLHGANRLASNSLLENIVMAESAANHLEKIEVGNIHEQVIYDELIIDSKEDHDRYLEKNEKLKNLMWFNFGIIRNESEMKRGITELKKMMQENDHEFIINPFSKACIDNRNRLHTALLIAQAAIERKESRGCHYRSDYPNH